LWKLSSGSGRTGCCVDHIFKRLFWVCGLRSRVLSFRDGRNLVFLQTLWFNFDIWKRKAPGWNRSDGGYFGWSWGFSTIEASKWRWAVVVGVEDIPMAMVWFCISARMGLVDDSQYMVNEKGRDSLRISAFSYVCYCMSKAYTVSVWYTSPGLRIVEGKSGLLGESGKCCVSRQKPERLAYVLPFFPVTVPSRKLPL